MFPPQCIFPCETFDPPKNCIFAPSLFCRKHRAQVHYPCSPVCASKLGARPSCRCHCCRARHHHALRLQVQSGGCTSGSRPSFKDQACGSCVKGHRAPGDGNAKLKEHNDKNKASGKRKQYNDRHAPMNNAKKKAKREEKYLRQAKSKLGDALHRSINDDEAQHSADLANQVYKHSMVQNFTCCNHHASPVAGKPGCPELKDESVAFLWGHNRNPVVQPFDRFPKDKRASKTTGFLAD
ncbi:unnamed protein product [Phaeothamnion confervicola]